LWKRSDVPSIAWLTLAALFATGLVIVFFTCVRRMRRQHRISLLGLSWPILLLASEVGSRIWFDGHEAAFGAAIEMCFVFSAQMLLVLVATIQTASRAGLPPRVSNGA
jgi:hypothetical protein